MAIDHAELKNRETILINKIGEYFKQNLTLFQDVMYYMRTYNKVNPVLKKGNVLIVTEFKECRPLKEFITRQDEYLKIFDWRVLTECALTKLQQGSI